MKNMGAQRYRDVRNHKETDFSSLIKKEEPPEKEEKMLKSNSKRGKKKKTKQQPKVVDTATRIRSSKMDNAKMKYAYSKRKMIIHDKDCSLVKNIPNIEFEMLEKLDIGMKLCLVCYRSALIRNGIEEGGKKIPSYLMFFKEIGATNKDLYTLLLRHEAKIKLMDGNTLRVQEKEDSWLIKKSKDSDELFHNNYIKLEGLSRYITSGYHSQAVFPKGRFQQLMQVILKYSWTDHVESELNELPIKNYRKVKKLSLLNAHYVFVNNDEPFAEQLFVDNQIRVRFGKKKEIEGVLYHVISCKVRKRDSDTLQAAFEKLKLKLLLSGYTDYLNVCKDFEEQHSDKS